MLRKPQTRHELHCWRLDQCNLVVKTMAQRAILHQTSMLYLLQPRAARGMNKWATGLGATKEGVKKAVHLRAR